ncbi:MAG: flagellar hook-basal body complex protein [Pseudomonadota bacterium]
MDNAVYATLSRQEGLNQAMRLIASNLANVSTDGYRGEGTVFAEWVERIPVDGGVLSQATATVRTTDFTQGGLKSTGAPLDLAIEGPGFFSVQAEGGVLLTRAGSFTLSPAGEIVASDGARLLDEGGAPLAVPAAAERIDIARDGTISADGAPIGRVGVSVVADLSTLTRVADTRFEPNGDVLPAGEAAAVSQGFIERSNVNAVLEMTRMIDVQRSYEAGQSFLRSEDERMREAIRVFGSS